VDFEISEWTETDRQTERQTNTLITIPCNTTRGKVITESIYQNVGKMLNSKILKQKYSVPQHLPDDCCNTVSLTSTKLKEGFRKNDRTKYCSDLFLDYKIHNAKILQTAAQIKAVTTIFFLKLITRYVKLIIRNK